MDIPDEIMIVIFSRLPSKSVGKFRSLSKSWGFRLSTSQFISLHLSFIKTRQENIILIKSSDSSLCTITPPLGSDAVSTKLEFQNITMWAAMVGSCNGLVLVANYDEKLLCLVNPLTAERVTIPDLDIPLEANYRDRLHGFGYDDCSDDYKIVSLSGSYIGLRVDVYSVKSGVWNEKVGIFTYNNVVPYGNGSFVGGAIHWRAFGKHTPRHQTHENTHYHIVVVAFDLANEVFYEIPVPLIAYDDRSYHLCVLEGCLCLIDNPSGFGIRYMSETDSNCYIWIMKQYGLGENWTKFCVESRGKWDIWVPFYFIGEEKEEIAVLTNDGVVVVYSLQKKTTREIAVDGVLAYFNDGVIFVDSLVSPRQIAENRLYKEDQAGRMERVGDQYPHQQQTYASVLASKSTV